MGPPPLALPMLLPDFCLVNKLENWRTRVFLGLLLGLSSTGCCGCCGAAFSSCGCGGESHCPPDECVLADLEERRAASSTDGGASCGPVLSSLSANPRNGFRTATATAVSGVGGEKPGGGAGGRLLSGFAGPAASNWARRTADISCTTWP